MKQLWLLLLLIFLVESASAVSFSSQASFLRGLKFKKAKRLSAKNGTKVKSKRSKLRHGGSFLPQSSKIRKSNTLNAAASRRGREHTGNLVLNATIALGAGVAAALTLPAISSMIDDPSTNSAILGVAVAGFIANAGWFVQHSMAVKKELKYLKTAANNADASSNIHRQLPNESLRQPQTSQTFMAPPYGGYPHPALANASVNMGGGYLPTPGYGGMPTFQYSPYSPAYGFPVNPSHWGNSSQMFSPMPYFPQSPNARNY